MTQRLELSLLDTGPCLNFFGSGQGALLLAVMERISAEIVIPIEIEDEVEDRAPEIQTYSGAHKQLQRAIAQGRVRVSAPMPGEDPLLERWVSRFIGVGVTTRRAKDLGERMVLAHALAARDRGAKVVVVIDEGEGRRTASKHQLMCIGTIDILRKAGLMGLVENWAEMRAIYVRMQANDQSLMSVDNPVVQERLRTTLNYGLQKPTGDETPLSS